MLWLALHFPVLPLEALSLRRSPSAVVAQGRVWLGDAAAQAAGVQAGHKLSTALGLLPGLAVCERDAGREAAALDQLACWAGRFTPTVSLAPPAALLLEIGGCLRLFGGLDAIVAAARSGCAALDYSLQWAVAPTPLGALWLARLGEGICAPDRPALDAALRAVPVAVPGWGHEVTGRLAAYGLHTLGELRSLPGASLRQRLGSGPVDELLRAWGEVPDPQRAFVFPERFAAELELPAKVEHAEALVFAGQRLLAALVGWLAGRQLRVRACTLSLRHDDGPPTPVVLRFAEPTADESRCLRLLREHLGRLVLAAPVEALSLQADETEAASGASAALFGEAVAGEGALACLERLRARLGDAAVQGLGEVADYRPECASRTGGVVGTGGEMRSGPGSNFDFRPKFDSPVGVPDLASSAVPDAPPAQRRPLWLLPVPQALAERGGRPQWHGPLKLLSGAERLESGWWDSGESGMAGDVRRDYFVARNPQGQWAWVFRNADGWFLHGLFA